MPQLLVRRAFSVRVLTAPPGSERGLGSGGGRGGDAGAGLWPEGGRAGSGALWASARSLREVRKAGLEMPLTRRGPAPPGSPLWVRAEGKGEVGLPSPRRQRGRMCWGGVPGR